MVLTIFDNEAGDGVKEHIECDNVIIHKAKGFVRLEIYKENKCTMDREFTSPMRAFLVEHGKTVDRVELR